ncbi:NTE family protein RssA [Planctomycetes bacterium CA13]|uniref:NTE family protein RssA n=1 Tax=Novipirellula herctigrandis TaxID=2527986 RepID=A0A5C5Z2T5_9BACT|nr:NTE family protein RssA [Planctomycetes bacterium CA13]
MTDDKFLLLKRHVCSEGLSDEVAREIADQCTLNRLEPGEYLHRAKETFTSVYFLIHGRVHQSVLDFRGNVMVQRHQTAGAQIGALACALGEPAPLDIVAEEPSTLLSMDYQVALRLTKKHQGFRQNYSKMIADAVMHLIMKDRKQLKPTLVGIFHQSSATRPLTGRLIKRLKELGERPHIMTDQSDWQSIDDVPEFSLTKDGDFLPTNEIQQKYASWSDSKRTFMDVDAALDFERITKVFQVCEKVFWCVTPENWRDSVTRLNAIVEHAPGWKNKINVVWLLPGDCRFAPLAPDLNDLAKRNFKLSFEEPPKNQSRELYNGFERIIHQLRGIRIGVALGGGAARGMAHLGVLKVLEQNGIVIDMIAGTSVGAMTGILYASGLDPDYNVDCFVSDLKPGWLFRHLPNGGYWYLLYKYRRRQFDPMLRKYLRDSRLEQLAIPVQSVTVDLISAQPVVRAAGDSVHAITESINLPVLSTPINRDGRSLVDGGIVNNVPADLLVANGCNFVIAASVTASLEKQFAKNRSDTPTSNMKSASAINTILRTYVVQNVNMNSVGVAPADFVIQPDVTEFDLAEFVRADEMAATGAATALEAIPKLKELLAEVDPQLFANE